MSIDLRNFGISNLQGSIYKGTFDDFDDLVANIPISNFGDVATVENSQGTSWLPFTFGGTYYPEGNYYFDGTIWVSNVKLIAQELQLINDSKDTYSFSASRDANNVNDTYLRKTDGVPTDESPFIIPSNGTLYAMSLATDGNETWGLELEVNGTVEATLSVTTDDKETGAFSFDVVEGDEISLFCDGSGISRPSATAFFKSR